MTLINKINKYWNFLENAYTPPKYVKSVKELKFIDLKKPLTTKMSFILRK